MIRGREESVQQPDSRRPKNTQDSNKGKHVSNIADISKLYIQNHSLRH